MKPKSGTENQKRRSKTSLAKAERKKKKEEKPPSPPSSDCSFSISLRGIPGRLEAVLFEARGQLLDCESHRPPRGNSRPHGVESKQVLPHSTTLLISPSISVFFIRQDLSYFAFIFHVPFPYLQYLISFFLFTLSTTFIF